MQRNNQATSRVRDRRGRSKNPSDSRSARLRSEGSHDTFRRYAALESGRREWRDPKVEPLQKSPEHGKGHRIGNEQGAVDGCVPVAAFRRRDHSLGGSLVLPLRHQLSRARGDDGCLGEFARTGDVTTTNVEPITLHPPRWNVSHLGNLQEILPNTGP